MTHGERHYALNVAGMYDHGISEQHRDWVFNGFCYDSEHCSFRGVFGDGGGSYVAEWIIQDGKARRTILSNSNDLVHLFLDDPMPPRFY